MRRYLTKAHRKLSISSHRRVRELLDGEYLSIFKGRGLDFEDLRQYVAGDNVKDIDWHATARIGAPMIKQYVAERKHNIVFAFDIGRQMACPSPDTQTKKELGLLVFGIIAYIGQSHGDNISLLAGDSSRIKLFHSTTKLTQIEMMLKYIDENTNLESPTQSLNNLLDNLRTRIPKRSLVVIITDRLKRDDELMRKLKKLSSKHEIMLTIIADQRPDDKEVLADTIEDVQTTIKLPLELRFDTKLSDAYSSWLRQDNLDSNAWLRRVGIPSVDIEDEDNVIPEVFRLLQRQRRQGSKLR